MNAAPLDTVRKWRMAGLRKLYPEHLRITVGMGSCGQAAGAGDVVKALAELVGAQGLPIDIVEVGCRGACFAEPVVEVQRSGCGRAVYANVEPADAPKILDAALAGDVFAKRLLGFQYRDDFPLLSEANGISPGEKDLAELPFFAIQNKRVTGKCGHIAPASVEEYAAYGGYFALASILETGNTRSADKLIDAIEASGLRGRGGAGFSTGRKWRAAQIAEADVKYLVANADEGDPGAFMDRSLMEGDPHALIEGMAIAAYAVDAERGYIFTRSEYPHAIRTLECALEQAREHGVLGEHILGSAFSFDIRIVKSAGAYVCGEATALVRAMEGFPGRPRKRPPHLADEGLWKKPTCVNNVETLANVPLIAMRGPSWFREAGTEHSPGTKTFSVAGAIEKTGLVEVPLGTRLNELIDALSFPSTAKAVQVGGPSGVIVPAHGNFKLDFESLAEAGGSIGSGGIVVLGQRDCIVDTVKYLIGFSHEESCGQCRACNDGLNECLELLDDITKGAANENTIAALVSCAEDVEKGSLCGLGKMAVRPLSSSLQFFRSEYDAHLDAQCPALVCKELIGFSVIAEKCPGCRCCKPTCPTNAMQGKFGKPYHIDERLCIRCWMCTATCPYNAVAVHSGPLMQQARKS